MLLIVLIPILVEVQAIPNIPHPQDCADHWALGARTSRVYTIYIGTDQHALDVY